MARAKKAVRKDKPKRDAWAVVHVSDVTRWRYTPTSEHPGMNAEHAQRLSSTPAGAADCWQPALIRDVAQHATVGMSIADLEQAKQDHALALLKAAQQAQTELEGNAATQRLTETANA